MLVLAKMSQKIAIKLFACALFHMKTTVRLRYFVTDCRYIALNVKLSYFQLKLKSEIKNNTEVTLKLSSNVVGDSNDENNFLHKL